MLCYVMFYCNRFYYRTVVMVAVIVLLILIILPFLVLTGLQQKKALDQVSGTLQRVSWYKKKGKLYFQADVLSKRIIKDNNYMLYIVHVFLLYTCFLSFFFLEIETMFKAAA